MAQYHRISLGVPRKNKNSADFLVAGLKDLAAILLADNLCFL
jgi:hypothetical protein